MAERPSADEWVEIINREYALLLTGGQPVILREVAENGRPPDLQFLSMAGFRAWFANRHATITDKTGKDVSAPVAGIWLASYERRQYDDLTFAPDPHPDDHRYNLWRGLAVTESLGGSWDCLREHLYHVICGGRQDYYNWFVNWMAQIIQRPAQKPGTAVVLRGAQGAGKTIVGQVLGKLLGPHYKLADDPRYLVGRFNGHLASCLLLQLDEATWGGDHTAAGKLKGLITSPTHLIEYKGREAIEMPNYTRVLITTNSAWAIPAGMDERRFFMLDVTDAHANDGPYFRDLLAELDTGGYGRLLYDLRHFVVVDEQSLRTVPRSAALLEQATMTLPPEAQWWLDTLIDGELPGGDAGEGLVDCAILYTQYRNDLKSRGVARALSANSFGQALRRLCPGLKRPRQGARGQRVWRYAIPPLPECREEITKLWPRVVDWGDDVSEGWQAARVQTNATNAGNAGTRSSDWFGKS